MNAKKAISCMPAYSWATLGWFLSRRESQENGNGRTDEGGVDEEVRQEIRKRKMLGEAPFKEGDLVLVSCEENFGGRETIAHVEGFLDLRAVNRNIFPMFWCSHQDRWVLLHG